MKAVRLSIGPAILILALCGSARAASTYYVTPTGAGGKDGSNWANAFDSVQAAVTASSLAGDVVYLKYGTYSLTAQVSVSSKPGLTLAGGYLGELGQSPGGRTNTYSVLKRTANYIRIISVGSSSTLTLDQLNLSDGWLVDNGKGAGLYVDGGATTLTNCYLNYNRCRKTADVSSGWGAGIYAQNTTLRLLGTTLYNNRAERAGGNHAWEYGGGLYASGTTLVASNCTFQSNYVSAWGQTVNGDGYGGAVYLTSGNARFADCAFLSNTGYGSYETYGGCVYASGLSTLTFDACTFTGNYGTGGSSSRYGGLLYLTGGGMTTRLVDCFITRSAAASTSANGEIYLASGTLQIENCEILRSAERGIRQGGGTLLLTNSLVAVTGGHGLYMTAGAATLVNVTAADNEDWGICQTGGSLAVSNSVA